MKFVQYTLFSKTKKEIVSLHLTYTVYENVQCREPKKVSKRFQF